MIIPLEDQSLYHIFRCGVCGNFYLIKDAKTGCGKNCLVDHPPGGCCHDSEYHLPEKKYKEINGLLSSITDK